MNKQNLYQLIVWGPDGEDDRIYFVAARDHIEASTHVTYRLGDAATPEEDKDHPARILNLGIVADPKGEPWLLAGPYEAMGSFSSCVSEVWWRGSPEDDFELDEERDRG